MCSVELLVEGGVDGIGWADFWVFLGQRRRSRRRRVGDSG